MLSARDAGQGRASDVTWPGQGLCGGSAVTWGCCGRSGVAPWGQFASAVLRGVEPSTLASVILAGAGSAAGHVLSDSDPAFSAIGAVLGAVLGFGLFPKVPSRLACTARHVPVLLPCVSCWPSAVRP